MSSWKEYSDKTIPSTEEATGLPTPLETLAKAASTHAPPPTTEDKKNRLRYVLHVGICCRTDCPMKHCAELKSLWPHIMGCGNMECGAKWCRGTRWVLEHWSACLVRFCEVCHDVRNEHTIEVRRALNTPEGRDVLGLVVRYNEMWAKCKFLGLNVIA